MRPVSPIEYSQPAAGRARIGALPLAAIAINAGACLCLLAAAALLHTGFVLLPPDTAMPIERNLVLLSPLLGTAGVVTAFVATLRRTGPWELAAVFACAGYWAGFAAAAFFRWL